MREAIITAVYNILDATHLFKHIYKMPTDVSQERSFPVAWISLKNESFAPDVISSTNYFRHIMLEIMLGKKQDYGENNMDALLDSVFDTIETNYTLGGSVINSFPIAITTDEGYTAPYALAAMDYKLLVR